MKTSRLILILSLVAIGSVAVHAGKPGSANAIIVSPNQTTQEEKSAEQANKNIQVLKGLPNSQLITVMHFMRTSLGVRCDYCHIAENGKYWMDDKPPKQVARRMIEMVSEINKSTFGGQPVVTCNTCHRGHTKPVAVPGVDQGVFTNTTREDASTKPADPLPSVDQVLDKYFQAIGGLTAAQKITTRVIKFSWLRPKLVNGGTPNAAIIARGDTWPTEIYQKAPNKYLMVITSPNGVIYQGFNGTTGWVKSPQGQRVMNGGELARFARAADLLGEFKLKQQYSQMTVTGRQKIDDREVYVIEALPVGTKPESNAGGVLTGASASTTFRRFDKLYFDAQSGLLLRRTAFTPISMGLDPEQTDFKDYTEADGEKLPFTIVVSYLDDGHLGNTRKYIEVKHNVPIDDSRFDPPK